MEKKNLNNKNHTCQVEQKIEALEKGQHRKNVITAYKRDPGGPCIGIQKDRGIITYGRNYPAYNKKVCRMYQIGEYLVKI